MSIKDIDGFGCEWIDFIAQSLLMCIIYNVFNTQCVYYICVTPTLKFIV